MKRPLNVDWGVSSDGPRDFEFPPKPAQPAAPPPAKNDALKWVALVVLVLQNSGLILYMRYSRVQAEEGKSYCISTAVSVAEFSKLFLSTFFLYIFDAECSFTELWTILRRECKDNWREFMKMCVPSGLYVLQNNLQYVGASHLPAAVFQVLVQMKIITTALFSVLMLSRKLSVMQWVAIVALGLGIGAPPNSAVLQSFLCQLSRGTNSVAGMVQISQGLRGDASTSLSANESSLIGIAAVLVSCLTSGFAGVYFEKVLKTHSTSLWVRNIQLALIGIVISTTTVLFNDWEVVSTDGFFRGYNSIVWTVVGLQAGGGLVVAVVVKYADNVLKGFATSVSVVLSCVVASFIFHGESKFNPLFLAGALIVCTAAFLFSSFPHSKGSAKNSHNTGVQK